MAKELGARHVINSKQTNPVEAIRDITGGGVDYSLEASGDPRALHQAIEALGSLGTCGIVGAEPLGTEVSFDVNNLMISGKGIRGILEGESVPDIFIPQLIELNPQGRFPFEKLTKFYNARLKHRKSPYRFIQQFWRHSRNGKKAPGTPNPTTGFSRADGTVVGNQSGARQFCASISAPWRSASGLRNTSDGIHFDTRTRLYCEVSAPSSK
jgi:NADPH:quinone reductase-like Zn-dependent oxidoreductase